MKRSLIFVIVILAAPVVYGDWLGSITADKSTGVLYTKALRGQSSLTNDPFELVVQCNPGEPIRVSIAWHEQFPDSESTVYLSFDGKESLTQQATTYLNKSAVSSLLPESEHLINFMKKYNKLDASTVFWRAARMRRGIFSLKGFTKAFNKYCWWHLGAMSEGKREETIKDLDAAIAFLDGPILIEAAAKGDLNTVKSMIEKGIKSDYRPAGRNSALMEASANGHQEIVRFLLKAGADPSLRNKSGQSAIDLARAAGHSAIVKMLQ